MGKGKPKANHREEKDGETQKLRNTIRRLQSDIRKLKSELSTYEVAFQKNIQFLKGKTKDLTVQELIEGAKKEQNLGQIENTKELTFKDMEKRWKCHKCNSGVMKLTVINRQDGRWYFRSCTDTKCKNRTELKPFNDEVEIS